MSRWTQYDEDDYRLPAGVQRVGYDSDSGRYFFRGSNGTLLQGEPGAQFGEMTRVNSLPASLAHQDDADGSPRDDLEASARTRNGYRLVTEDEPMAHRYSVNMGAYRTLFPFFLIIAVVLLLIWRLIISPGLITPPRSKCPEGTSSIWIQPGDSCWELSREYGWTMEKFKEVNPKVVCDPLIPGTSVCLPPKKSRRQKS